MADPITIALTAIKTASDIAKVLRGIDKSFEQAELKMRIADLVEALAEARMAVADTQDTVRELRERVAQLEAIEDVRDRLERRSDVYWLVDSQDRTPDAGPYCVRCFDVTSRLVTVVRPPVSERGQARYKCPECANLFGPGESLGPSTLRVERGA